MTIALQGTPTIAEAGSATSIAVAYPAGIVSGELLIATIGVTGSTAPSSVPVGWSLHKSQNGPGTTPSVAVYFKIANGSESGSVVFNTDAAAGAVTVIMERWSGVDNYTPFDAAPVSANSTANVNFTMPSITTVSANAVLVHSIALFAVTASDIVTLAGTTLIGDSTGVGRRTGAYYEAQAIAGASGTRTWTDSTATALQWAGITAALRPAGLSLPQTESLANTRRAYWLQTITTGGNLSNDDLFEAFLQNKTATTNLSVQDMEKIYWKSVSGSTDPTLSVADYQAIVFAPYQDEELYWLRAQL